MYTVVFDLDGTLADTSRDLIAAANSCFRMMGAGDVLDEMGDAATAMHGGRAMLRLGLERLGRAGEEETVERYFPQLLTSYAENIDTHTMLYPGAIDSVEQLKREGFGAVVCTNKPEALALDLLARLGVLDLFGSVIGADTLSVRKPDPEPLRESVRRIGGDPSRALLVGDTVTDRDTSRAAGVPSVLVTFGPNGHAVAELKPDALIDHYSELPGVVARLIG